MHMVIGGGRDPATLPIDQGCWLADPLILPTVSNLPTQCHAFSNSTTLLLYGRGGGRCRGSVRADGEGLGCHPGCRTAASSPCVPLCAPPPPGLFERIRNHEVVFKQIPTTEMVADIFTKPLAFLSFSRF